MTNAVRLGFGIVGTMIGLLFVLFIGFIRIGLGFGPPWILTGVLPITGFLVGFFFADRIKKWLDAK